MDQIRYAGNTLITGSEIAHAVLAYARALAAAGDSATISIPVQHEDGSVVEAEILIGPASQLIAEPYASAFVELEDAAVITHLQDATAKLQTPRAVPEDHADYSAVDSGDLELPDGALDG